MSLATDTSWPCAVLLSGGTVVVVLRREIQNSNAQCSAKNLPQTPLAGWTVMLDRANYSERKCKAVYVPIHYTHKDTDNVALCFTNTRLNKGLSIGHARRHWARNHRLHKEAHTLQHLIFLFHSLTVAVSYLCPPIWLSIGVHVYSETCFLMLFC